MMYALEAFEVKGVDYILKPIKQKLRFIREIQKFKEFNLRPYKL